MADSGRVKHNSPNSSPGPGRKKAQQSPGSKARYSVNAPGHCFRKVTLTKPTFCHHCSDFIWGIVGFVCEVCNFMSHEKCLKHVRTVCSCMASTQVWVPVAHCFGPAGQKKRFCCVCRKHLEGSLALRCEVCELHVHSDCAPFSVSDCRFCHQDGGQDIDTYQHHWREGNMSSGARCEVCRRTCSSSDVLAGVRCEWCGITEASLRAFYIPDEPQDYELQSYSQQGLFTDDIINRNGTPDNKSIFKDTVSDSWVLRSKPRETEVVKIYSGPLKAEVISVTAGKSSTVDSIIKEVHSRIGKQNENPADYNLVEVFMSSKQVQRQVLSGQEILLDKLQEIRKTSLRQMNQTRFYIEESRNRVAQVNLLLGGFPTQLEKEEYTRLLSEHLEVKSHLVSITHAYSEQGAVVLQISCFSEAERIYMLAKDISISGKQLYSLVIPEIMQSNLAKGSCPLLVFVNPKSGGLKGREILYSFRKLLNPHQVFELTSGGPLAGLHTFKDVPHFRILVCGGDGTVGWVLGVLESIRHKIACPEPAISIIPLGTGNDLARVLRWGTGYSGEDPYNILLSVDEAEEVQMDRWTILLDAQEMTEDGKENGFLEPPKIVHMNNYFGLGIDAELSLDFHHAREEDPDKFNSRFHNKGVYVKVGLQKLSHTRNLHKDIRLQVDRQEVELPSIEGLIFLNIPSWGSGADLWGSDSDSRFGRPRIDDGMLEVVGVTGVVHMVQSGLRSGIRIAQGSYIRITVNKPIPVQVDGEPWIQSPGQIIISAAGPKVCMLRKSKAKQKKQSGSLKESRSDSPAPSDGGQ
ncbi:diacylglycerol kinase theta [Labeo rohita]|uniref:Diacylglycerol kinase n=1 Tax=Labeo rohita TaxID=84645 RepID=A0A498N406_LABRO|nr:diacylglycerol kinase theta [Labeo rohita]